MLKRLMSNMKLLEYKLVNSKLPEVFNQEFQDNTDNDQPTVMEDLLRVRLELKNK